MDRYNDILNVLQKGPAAGMDALAANEVAVAMAAGMIVDAAKAETGGTAINPEEKARYEQMAHTVLGMNKDFISQIASFFNDAVNAQNTNADGTGITMALSTVARMDGAALRQVLEAFVSEDELDLFTAQTLFRLMQLREAMAGKASGAEDIVGNVLVQATSNALKSTGVDIGNPDLDDAVTIAASTSHNLDIARDRWGMAGVHYIGNLIQSGRGAEAALIISLPSHAKAVIVAEENMRTVALNQDAILAQANAVAQDMQNPYLMQNATKRAGQQALLALKAELTDGGALGDRSGLEQGVKTAERILDQSKSDLNRAIQREQGARNAMAAAQARFKQNMADTGATDGVIAAVYSFQKATDARRKAQQAVTRSQQALTDARQKLNGAQKQDMANVEAQAREKLGEMRLKLAEERARRKEQVGGQSNAHRRWDGLTPLQSVDLASERAPLLAKSNESGIIKEGRQQLEPDAEMTLQGPENGPIRALASAGAVTDTGYANGASPYNEPGAYQEQQKKSDSANGVPDEEVFLKDTNIDLRDYVPTVPSVIEPIPKFEIQFSDKGNYLLNKGVYPDVNEYTLMPLNYLKQVQARMIQEGFTYAGGGLDRTGKKTECVGMTRLPAILWYSSSMYFRLQDENIIETEVSNLYENAAYKGLWNDKLLLKFDGMQLVDGKKSHIATYYTDFSVEYNGDPKLDLSEYKRADVKYEYDEAGKIVKTIITYYDVVVDITGKRYGKNPTDEKVKEVDSYNNPSDGKNRKEIRIRDYDTAKEYFTYWCALDYVDYGDQKDPDSNRLTPNKDIPLKKEKRK